MVELLRHSVVVKCIFVIDNSEKELVGVETLPVTYLFNNKNLGYGAAHNIALRQSIAEAVPYHLIVNADIHFAVAILEQATTFLDQHADIGLLMPKVFYPNGKIQYLCKLLPTPFDLFGRRFLPKTWMQRRTEHFELRASGYDRVMNVPYLSGCFMLLRTKALTEVGLFDERFFMYPEDVDLTRRMHRLYKTVFYPDISVVHRHAQGSYKNVRLLCIHVVNLIRYFNKWGWFCDAERIRVNRETINRLLP